MYRIRLCLRALGMAAASGLPAAAARAGLVPRIFSPMLAAAQSDSFFGHLLKQYVPRRCCMYQERGLIWLHVIGDAVIALAYYSIPIALLCFRRKRRDISFNWIFICFAVFILACGAGHALAALAIWHPLYRLDGLVKAVTALASVGTAAVLWPLLHKAVALPSPAQLQAANKELESFSYSVSHDLRAPLRHLDGFSAALLEDYGDRLDAQGREHLGRIRAASQRMGRLIDDLLELSKVSQTKMRLQRTDATQMAREIAAELRGTAADREVEFVIEAGVTANADPGLLPIVLNNLLANAWKFTSRRPAGRIEFGYLARDINAYFVRDNGAGFDMTYAGKLFGAFQRLHSPEEFPGTGIGLATVQRIISRHGGKVWAQGKVGSGATFYFRI